MDHFLSAKRSHTLSSTTEKVPKHHGQFPPALGAKGLVRLSTTWLFHSAKEVEIEHRGDLYRLRQTALGKLILTK
jgi:hypothetical protein